MKKVLKLFVTEYINDDRPTKKKGDCVVPQNIVTTFDYDEIIICGGEPFVFLHNLERLLQALFMIGKTTGVSRKVLVETSLCDFWKIDDTIKYCDGVICTPKTKNDMAFFKQLNNELLKRNYVRCYEEKDLRLNILPQVRDFFHENLKVWQVTELIENTVPMPVNCDYRRITELWEKDLAWYDLTRNM